MLRSPSGIGNARSGFAASSRRFPLETPQHLSAIEPEVIGIGAQKSDRIDGARQLVWVSSLKRLQIGGLDPQRGCGIGQIEPELLLAAAAIHLRPIADAGSRTVDAFWRFFR